MKRTRPRESTFGAQSNLANSLGDARFFSRNCGCINRDRANTHTNAVEEGERVFACKDWCTNTTRPRGFRKEQQVWHPLPSTFYLPPLTVTVALFGFDLPTLEGRPFFTYTNLPFSARYRRENNTRVARAWGKGFGRNRKNFHILGGKDLCRVNNCAKITKMNANLRVRVCFSI